MKQLQCLKNMTGCFKYLWTKKKDCWTPCNIYDLLRSDLTQQILHTNTIYKELSTRYSNLMIMHHLCSLIRSNNVLCGEHLCCWDSHVAIIQSASAHGCTFHNIFRKGYLQDKMFYIPAGLKL